MIQQDLFSQRTADTGEVDRMIAYLTDRDGWVNAAAIGQRFGWEFRKVRAIASASKGCILSSHLGYKLTAHATAEEYAAADGRFRSQIRAMLRRRKEMRVAFNRGGRAAA